MLLGSLQDITKLTCIDFLCVATFKIYLIQYTQLCKLHIGNKPNILKYVIQVTKNNDDGEKLL